MADPKRTSCGEPVPGADGAVCKRLPAHHGDHRATLTKSAANRTAHRTAKKAGKTAAKTGPRLPKPTLVPDVEPVAAQVTKPKAKAPRPKAEPIARVAAMQAGPVQVTKAANMRTPNREAKTRATATG